MKVARPLPESRVARFVKEIEETDFKFIEKETDPDYADKGLTSKFAPFIA